RRRGRLGPAARERLAHDVVAMRRERVRDLRVALDREHDAVRDFEAGLLARILHGTHELARDAFALELGRERGIEADEVAALLRARPAFGRSALDEQIVRVDLDLLPRDDEALRLAARDGARDRGTVGVRQELANRRDQLAVTLADDGQVRLDAVG